MIKGQYANRPTMFCFRIVGFQKSLRPWHKPYKVRRKEDTSVTATMTERMTAVVTVVVMVLLILVLL